MSFLSKFFSNGGASVLRDASSIVEKVNALEPSIKALSNDELRSKTEEFKKRLKNGEALEELAPEAFAVVREASVRTLGQRHFDVQLIGGIVLHKGNIAEMRTGEGKTLVATLPAYLNALSGDGVHIVTVNDYLSRRDGSWMGQIYYALGLSVAVMNTDASFIYDPSHATPQDDANRDETGAFKVVNDFLRPCTRREAYAADILYGTNNEYGFDYLRDNIEREPANLRQRPFNYAIVDEIDSILIDEARTPLIISAAVSDAERLYERFAQIARTLVPENDYTTDLKHKQIQLTDQGIEKAEKSLGIGNMYTDAGIKYVHHLETAVRAKALFERDKEYVVREGQVIIVDEFTGRLQPGRRWSEGLHQAIEAKEGVAIQQESRTMASITFQNYFRLYKKLSGMTGTAATSSEEFYKVYGLNVISIPTNKPIARTDNNDLIFQSERGKMKALARHIKDLHEKGQPVLVGTVSVEKNELLSVHFKQEGIPHEVLNAKNHEREGEIIAQAGQAGKVTIATNMAGRGVDIKLGGNPGSEDAYEQVKSVGGLTVIGTERHEARRIDNQLRGRAGRQGDPGQTQFFVSLEDSLMRIFASDMIKRVMGTFGIPEDEPIYNGMITKSLEKAQTRIEELNFDARKHVLAYDDVLNVQRTAVYERRRALLTGDDGALEAEVTRIFSEEGDEEMVEAKKKELGEGYGRAVRVFLLQTIDFLWMEHLEAMEYLRGSVNLRAYGQRDPLVEYKKEGLELFRSMEETYKERARSLFPHLQGGGAIQTSQQKEPPRITLSHANQESTAQGKAATDLGRNDKVVITNGTETRELKFKKAEALLKQGWKIVSK